MASYSHRIRMIGPDHYRLSWTVDHTYPSSRLRFPRVHTRDTDEAGAKRFSKRHECPLPATPSPQTGG